jgi:hypothetical protein
MVKDLVEVLQGWFEMIPMACVSVCLTKDFVYLVAVDSKC